MIGSSRIASSVAIVLAVCAVALYARTLGYDYVWDDLMYLGGFQQYQGLAGVVRAVAEPFFLYPDYYRPLAMASFVVSREPSMQHGINVALHALNVALVFLCARALMVREVAGSSAGVVSAALGALVFAVHPLAVEPVAWVSGRFDTLMSSFVLGTCLVALSGELTCRRLTAIFLLFACAMGSKEAAIGLPVALPFLFLLKYRLAGGESGAHIIAKRLVPLLEVLAAAAALYVAIRLLVIHRLFTGADAKVTFAGGVLDKLNIAALAAVAFVKLMVNPWSHSAPLHPFIYEANGSLPQTLVVATAVLALLALAALKKPRLNFPLALLAALGMGWPVLHLIGIPYANGGNIISDRYALTPLALLLAGMAAVAGAWVVQRTLGMGASEKRALKYIGVFVLLWAGALAAHSNVTIPMWRNEHVLWAFAHRQVPSSILAHKSYIKTLMMQELWDDANTQLNQFFEDHPENLEKLDIVDITNWMVVRAKTGDYRAALELFSLSESILERADLSSGEDMRSFGILYRARGIIEGDIGHWQQALRWHEKSAQVSPTDVRSAFRYAEALFMTGQQEKAEEVFSRALAGSTRELAAWALEWRKGWQLPPAEAAEAAGQGASAPAPAPAP